MTRKQKVIFLWLAGGFLVLVAVLIAIGLWAAPQSNNLSKEQVLNQAYNATDGSLQIDLVNGSRSLTPQSGTYSPEQIWNYVYNATDGAIQVSCDNCGGGGELDAYTNVTSQTIDIQALTDDVEFFQVLDADGGTAILNIDTTNERIGIKIEAPEAPLDVDGDTIIRSGASNEVVISPGTNIVNFKFNTTSFLQARSTGRVGFGVNPTNNAVVQSLSTSEPQMQLIHTSGSVYTNLQAESDGDLAITTTGDEMTVNAAAIFKSYTTDPCGSIAEGALWYNDTDDIYCYCDGGGDDLKVSDDNACF